MNTRHCLAMSVDIDRFSDAKLRRDFLPMFRDAFGCKTPKDIRQRCELARLKGFAVFPPCDNARSDGHCAGHPVEAHP